MRRLAAVMLFSWLAASPRVVASQSNTPDVEITSSESVLGEVNALRLAGKYEEGITLALSVLEHEPSAPRFHYALGILHGLSSRHSEALSNFERELALDPAHVESYRGAAAALSQLGRTDEALAKLQLALAIAPKDPDLLTEVGQTQSAAGDFEEAIATFHLALAEGADTKAALELGLALRRSARFEDAAEVLRRALLMKPNDVQIMFNLGQTLQALGQSDAAAALLERHAELAAVADEVDVLERSSRLSGASALNFIRLADALLRLGDARGAENAFRRALQLDQNSAAAALGLSSLALRSGQSTAATQWAIHALLTQPNNWKAHFQLGLLRLAGGEQTLAAESFERSRELGSWDGEAYLRCAEAYRRAGLGEEAQGFYSTALAANAQSSRVHRGLGLTQLRLNQLESAVESLGTALGLAPDDPTALLGLALAWRQVGDDVESIHALSAVVRVFREAKLTGQSTAPSWRELQGLDGAEQLRTEIDRQLAD